MKLADTGARRKTRSEYYQMAEAGLLHGQRVELIRGEIVFMSPQDSQHATCITLADNAFRKLFGNGFVIRVQMPLRLGLDSDPEPDIAIVPGEPQDFARAHPTGASLVFEASGASLEYDRAVKGSLYAEAAIPEFWIANLIDRQLEVCRDPAPSPAGQGGFNYREKKIYALEDRISPLASPQAALKVAELFPS